MSMELPQAQETVVDERTRAFEQQMAHDSRTRGTKQDGLAMAAVLQPVDPDENERLGIWGS